MEFALAEPAVLVSAPTRAPRKLQFPAEVRAALMGGSERKDRKPSEILNDLVQQAIAATGISIKDAAARARGRTGFSERNIYEAITNYDPTKKKGRKKHPSARFIKELAKLFNQSPDVWLGHFPDLGQGHFLVERDQIVAMQAALEPGAIVTLVSSAEFLEASDDDLARLVLGRLDAGVVYRYYFPAPPKAKEHPYGRAAYDSYVRFRDHHARRFPFSRGPVLLGFALNPAEFEYFSGLHTLVRYDSERAAGSGAFAFIRPVAADGRPVELWYPLPEAVWRDIKANLDRARVGVADDGLSVADLNPLLTNVRDHYTKWFRDAAHSAEYAELRTALGHSGDRCLQKLTEELRRRKVGTPAEVSYLDIGCGDGNFARGIAALLLEGDRAVNVTLLDPSVVQLELARQAFLPSSQDPEGSDPLGERDRLRLELLPQPFEELVSAAGPLGYDVITSVHSFYTIDAAYLRSIWRLLRPGGVAFIWLAQRAHNVLMALCDGLDEHLRRGQRRNAAEDLNRYARSACIPCSYHVSLSTVSELLNGDRLSDVGSRIVAFCALTSRTRSDSLAPIAVPIIKRHDDKEGRYLLYDGLLLLHRPPATTV